MSGSAIDERQFRQALGAFATGIGVVTCRVGDTDHAMTANAISSVSLRPPLVLVAIETATRFWEAVSDQQNWAVSVLTDEAREHAAWLATSGRPLAGQLDRVPHHRSAAGIALLDDALVWLECRTHDAVTAGDHHILIGEVTAARPGRDGDALLYWRSRYRRLPRD